jgi:NAD-dependent dihydropyrimidine dehydrogenase PreA subunit
MASLKFPREKILWFPTIDRDLCIGDQDCVNFCRNDVLAFDEDSFKAVVLHPYSCVVGCSACAQICPQSAIAFPSKEELKKTIRRLLSEAHDEAKRSEAVDSSQSEGAHKTLVPTVTSSEGDDNHMPKKE